MLQSIWNGLSSLTNHRKALDVTTHNIANVNTEGYSKQRANLENNFTRQDGNHQIGVGVHTKSVTRMHNEILFNRVLDSTSNNASSNEEFVHLQRVEDIVVGEGLTGNTLGELVDQFFDNVQLLASEANSNSLKENIRINGEELINRGSKLNEILNDYKDGMNNEKNLLLEEASGYLSEIKGLTKGIQEVEAFNEFEIYEKSFANDLRDKRDLLELKLSEIGNFNSNEGKPYDYNYTFKEDGERLEGILNATNNIQKLQDSFNNKFGKVGNKVEEFINGEMNNSSDMLQWRFDNTPSKNINSIFISFSSTVDNIGNTASSTESIMRGLAAQNDKLTKVSLDEELVNQIRYQRAYEAAAKVIQTSDEMLKTIINMKQ